MKNSAIRERRQKVSNLIIKGKTETEIAGILFVHRNTIVRDVSFLKNQSHNWLDGLAKNGFIYEYKLSLDKSRDHERELQKLFEDSEEIGQKTQSPHKTFGGLRKFRFVVKQILELNSVLF